MRSWGMNRRRRGLYAAALVCAVAIALAGCKPVLHTQATIVEPPGSPARIVLLSGDARYSVVVSTGPAATVPGAGTWRVDRGNRSTLQLPGGTPTEISYDGSRVLYGAASLLLWSNGVQLTPPTGTTMSQDLTYGIFVDTDGVVKTWSTATQTVTSVEATVPRPAGYTALGDRCLERRPHRAHPTVRPHNHRTLHRPRFGHRRRRAQPRRRRLR